MILFCGEPGCDWTIDEDTLEPGVKPTAETRVKMHRSNKHGVRPGEEAAMADPKLSTAEVTGPFGGAHPTTGEVPPASSEVTRSAGTEPPRRRGLFSRKPKPTLADPRPTKEKAPKSKTSLRGRVSAADTFADLWGWGGGLMGNAGHVPTGRMVKFQAPIAGELLDDVVKGTIVDKMVVQKVVGARGKLDLLFAIFGPPVLTWRMEQAIVQGNQSQLDVLEPMLKSAVKNALPVMIPALAKARKREAAANTALAELMDADELDGLGIHIVDGKPIDADGQSVDVGDVFVGMLFSNWETPVGQPPPNQPAEESVQ